METTLSVDTVYQSLKERLGLSWIAGHRTPEKVLSTAGNHWNNATLVGHMNLIHPHCVQVLGERELTYLDGLDAGTLESRLLQLFNNESVIVLIADDKTPLPEMIQLANQGGAALFTSKLPTQELISTLQYYLSEALAQTTTLHGVFMEVLGTGVLITGESNMGKSELALELISRGQRLIADDAPEFARVTPDTLQGRCPAMLQDMLEVRGLGILNIRAMYGDNAIKFRKYLKLIIDLCYNQSNLDQDKQRLHGFARKHQLLGIEVPVIEIPVAPSRNLAVLVEASVRKHLLLESGYDAAKDLIQRQQHRLENES